MALTSPVRPSGSGASAAEPGGADLADTTEIPVVLAGPADGAAAPSGSGAAIGVDDPAARRRQGLLVGGTALCILAALLLGLVAELTVVGSLEHTRDQQVLHDQLRKDLADARTPVGQSTDGALVAPGTPVALLSIPAIGLEQIVVEGTTSTQLVSGPGHLRDTVLPGQPGTSVLMGRQAAYGGPFARLAELKPGAVIDVTTGQGEQSFVVTGARAGGAPAPPLRAGQARLTLVTADGPPYAPTGTLWVDARATTPARPAAPLQASAVPVAERPMSGDPAAWIPLVFWAQALVLAALALVWAALRWGRRQAWVVGIPVLAFLGLSVAGEVARLLPNLL